MSRLSHRNKSIKIRGFNVLRDDVQLNVVPTPAQYKEIEKSFVMQKTGYVSFEFLPFSMNTEEGKKRPDTLKRRVMIVTMKNIRDIIDIDADSIVKDPKPTILQYKAREDDPTTRVISI